MGTYFQRLAQRSALAPALSTRGEDAPLPLEQETEVVAPATAARTSEPPLAREVQRGQAAHALTAPPPDVASASGAPPDRSPTMPPRPQATTVHTTPSIAPARVSDAGEKTDAAGKHSLSDAPRPEQQLRPGAARHAPGREPEAPRALPGASGSLTHNPPPARTELPGESMPQTRRAAGPAPYAAAAPERFAEGATRAAAAPFTAEAKPGRPTPGAARRSEAADLPVRDAPRPPRAVEVRIGSVTVEIHQAPPSVPSVPLPPAPRRERRSGFSASRHYLRED